MKRAKQAAIVLEGECSGLELCPLSRVKAGAVVCIKQITLAPEASTRLREMGFCEEQEIKVLARDSTFICQICNARLGLSAKLAESILVEAVARPLKAA